MPIQASCPHCGAIFNNLPDEKLGSTARCSKCKEKFKVERAKLKAKVAQGDSVVSERTTSSPTSWFKAVRGFAVRWGRPVRFVVKNVLKYGVPTVGPDLADAVDKVLECVQNTAVDQEKAEARARTILSAKDLERVSSILAECDGPLADLMKRISKLDGLPESTDEINRKVEEIIREQRAANERVQAGFEKIAGFAEQFDRIEAGVGRVEAKVDETHYVIQQLRQEVMNVAKQIGQEQLMRRELQPKDSLSIRNDRERQLVKSLVARYRALPEDQRHNAPELLNDIGKLEVVAGDFAAAQKDFQQVATLVSDTAAQANAHFNAYRAALERRDMDVALREFREAVKLDPRRYAPFPVGKYHPKRILGAGGFGVAFLCRHKDMNADVVVKTLAGDDLGRDVDEVLAEARLLDQLDHPCIVQVKDCGYTLAAKKARPYFVMKFFESVTLEEQVQKAGKLSPDDIVEVGRQMAEGLQAAHGKQIFHRDVKPANVLVRKDGTKWHVKLIDFGLALKQDVIEIAASTAKRSKTLSGSSIAGTLEYAAPEQMGKLPGVPVGAYSDIYGFGKTCCYALFQTTQPLPKHWKSLPEEIAEILEQCLEEEPQNRPQSFNDVLEKLRVVGEEPALEGVLVGEEVPAARPPEPDPEDAAADELLDEPPPPPMEKCRFCMSSIPAGALKCMHCKETLDPTLRTVEEAKRTAEEAKRTAEEAQRAHQRQRERDDEDYDRRQKSRRVQDERPASADSYKRAERQPQTLFSKMKTRLLGCGVLILLSFACCAGLGHYIQKWQEETRAKQKAQIAEADKLYESGKKQDAVALYKSLFNFYPNQAECIKRIVETEIESGATDSAKQWVLLGIQRNISVAYDSAAAQDLLAKLQSSTNVASIGPKTDGKKIEPFKKIEIDRKLDPWIDEKVSTTLNGVEFRTDTKRIRFYFTFLNETGKDIPWSVNVNDSSATDQNKNPYKALAQSALALPQGEKFVYWIEFQAPSADAKVLIARFKGRLPDVAVNIAGGPQPVTKKIQVGFGNNLPTWDKNLTIVLDRIEVRPEGTMRWWFTFTNDSGQDIPYWVRYGGSTVTDQNGSPYKGLNQWTIGPLPRGHKVMYWIDFQGPASDAKVLTVQLDASNPMRVSVRLRNGDVGGLQESSFGDVVPQPAKAK